MPALRTATASDLDALAALVGVLFAQEQEFSPNPRRQRAALTRILASPWVGVVLVAVEDEPAPAAHAAGDAGGEVGGDLVGMVSLLWTVSTATGSIAALLEDMVVRPDRRGAGVGSMLVEEALQVARAAGATRITLLTDADNDGARRLYERHGFVRSSMAVMRWVDAAP